MPLLVALAVILFLLWVGGLAIHIAGAFIHILLVLAIIALVVGFIGGRRTV